MSIEACRELVRMRDPDRFMSVMAAHIGKRDALFSLYAFNTEIARAPWASSEEMIAEMRVQWWADAVRDLYAGAAPKHEVLGPLADTIHVHGFPQEMLQSMIEARRFDIYRDAHVDMAAFDTYIDTTSGNLMQLAAMTLGANTEAMPVISDFAYGAGVANLLRALPALYAHGRHPIPVDCALDRNAVAEGSVPDNLVQALQEVAQKAQAKIAQARAKYTLVPKSAAPAMLANWQVDVPLRMVLNAPKSTLAQPLETSEFRKKLSLLWKSSRGSW